MKLKGLDNPIPMHSVSEHVAWNKETMRGIKTYSDVNLFNWQQVVSKLREAVETYEIEAVQIVCHSRETNRKD